MALNSARPRDLARLRDALNALPALEASLAGYADGTTLDGLRQHIRPFPELAELLTRALVDNPPVVIRDGVIVSVGDSGEVQDDSIEVIDAQGGWITPGLFHPQPQP